MKKLLSRHAVSRQLIGAAVGGALMIATAPAYADREDKPSGFEMAADAVVARPLGLALTTLGAAAFVVSLPFSALGGNVKGAADALVIDPAKATFVRCLGCKTTGREIRERK